MHKVKAYHFHVIKRFIDHLDTLNDGSVLYDVCKNIYLLRHLYIFIFLYVLIYMRERYTIKMCIYIERDTQ